MQISFVSSQSKLTFMWPALFSGAVSIIGLYVVLTFVCFSAFLTENHVAVMNYENGFFLNLTTKEHFVTLFIGSVVQGKRHRKCYYQLILHWGNTILVQSWFIFANNFQCVTFTCPALPFVHMKRFVWSKNSCEILAMKHTMK